MVLTRHAIIGVTKNQTKPVACIQPKCEIAKVLSFHVRTNWRIAQVHKIRKVQHHLEDKIELVLALYRSNHNIVDGDQSDGAWSQWTLFSSCSADLGGCKRSRNRTCDSPPPTAKGLPCSGDYQETEDCASDECRYFWNKLRSYSRTKPKDYFVLSYNNYYPIF